jgi:hypothetical protein
MPETVFDRAVAAMGQRYETMTPLGDDWVEQCVAAVFEVVALEMEEAIDAGPSRCRSEEICSFVEELKQQASEYPLVPPNGSPQMIDTPVENLDIGTMATGALRRNGVHTVADLLERGRKRIRAINLIGDKAENDISRALAELGFQWTIEGKPQDQHLSPGARQLVAAVDTASPRRTVANILQIVAINGLNGFDVVNLILELGGCSVDTPPL